MTRCGKCGLSSGHRKDCEQVADDFRKAVRQDWERILSLPLSGAPAEWVVGPVVETDSGISISARTRMPEDTDGKQFIRALIPPTPIYPAGGVTCSTVPAPKGEGCEYELPEDRDGKQFVTASYGLDFGLGPDRAALVEHRTNEKGDLIMRTMLPDERKTITSAREIFPTEHEDFIRGVEAHLTPPFSKRLLWYETKHYKRGYWKAHDGKLELLYNLLIP